MHVYVHVFVCVCSYSSKVINALLLFEVSTVPECKYRNSDSPKSPSVPITLCNRITKILLLRKINGTFAQRKPFLNTPEVN